MVGWEYFVLGTSSPSAPYFLLYGTGDKFEIILS
jgi:hypothetical protein